MRIIAHLARMLPLVICLNGDMVVSSLSYNENESNVIGSRQLYMYDVTATLQYDEPNGDDEITLDSELGKHTEFDARTINVTIVMGDTAVLPCSVKNIASYKVAWLDDYSIPLTYEDRRVVDDPRYGVVRPAVDHWDLQVRDVRRDDGGRYLCTLNTNPVRSKVVFVTVTVPTQIIDDLSSDDVIVREHHDLTLVCNATGEPPPTVTWYRENPPTFGNIGRPALWQRDAGSRDDCNLLELGNDGSHRRVVGETLTLRNVTRYCGDVYRCIADNDVSPPVSRRMRVSVEFAPEIVLPNKRISQSRDRETILECLITANPHATSYWEKDGRRITGSSSLSVNSAPVVGRHRIEAYESLGSEDSRTLTLSLRVHVTDSTDYGEYKCVAANRFGKKNATMYLYEPIADIVKSIVTSSPPRWASRPRGFDASTTRSESGLTATTSAGGRISSRVGKSPYTNGFSGSPLTDYNNVIDLRYAYRNVHRSNGFSGCNQYQCRHRYCFVLFGSVSYILIRLIIIA